MKHADLWRKHIVPTIRRDSWMDDDDFSSFLEACEKSQGGIFDDLIDDAIAKGADPELTAKVMAQAVTKLS